MLVKRKASTVFSCRSSVRDLEVEAGLVKWKVVECRYLGADGKNDSEVIKLINQGKVMIMKLQSLLEVLRIKLKIDC
jgi:hypothetical protein